MNKNLKSLLIPIGFAAGIAIIFVIWHAAPHWLANVFTVLWITGLIVVPAIMTGLWSKTKSIILNLFK